MRFALLFAATVVGTTSLAADVIDVLIVAGQSNAVGFDAPPDQMPGDPIDNQILFWYRCGDPPPDKHDTISDGWTTLEAQSLGNPIKPRRDRQYGNYAQATGGFGPEIGLARDVAKQNDRKLAIIKVAFSGTHVSGDWNPNLSADAPGKTAHDCRGACYRSLVSETNRALQALSNHGQPNLIALAWIQGESDATAERAGEYTKNLTEMIAALRRELQTPNLFALLAVNTKFQQGKNKYMPTVITAQQTIADRDSKVAYVDTASASIANNVHFDAPGTIDVGQRFAKKLGELRKANSRTAD